MHTSEEHKQREKLMNNAISALTEAQMIGGNYLGFAADMSEIIRDVERVKIKARGKNTP